MKILKYINASNILIEFQDEHKVVVSATTQNFKRGTVKNPYDKSAYGIGYIGEGNYKTGRFGDNYPTKEYTSWKNLMRRCYSEIDKEKYPAYYGICTVCEEWHNFQNYAKWYNENYYEIDEGRMHLDKDILVKDNKLYSPDRCVFIPQRINMIFMEKPKSKDKDLPNTIQRCTKGFKASYNGKSLGIFKTLTEAIEAHDSKMRLHIKKVAEEYKVKINNEVIHSALINW